MGIFPRVCISSVLGALFQGLQLTITLAPDDAPAMTQIRLARISRYPVKGLSEQSLDQATLSPGQPLPGDRRFALAHGASSFDAAAPAWFKKAHFLNWARNPAIAAMQARFDASGTRVSLHQGGAALLSDADLTSEQGRKAITDFLIARLPTETRGKLVVAEAAGVSFTDVEPPYLSIQNSASIADIGKQAGRAFDQRRLRGNLLLDGLEPWAEMTWPGKRLRIGGAELEVIEIIGRCPATTLDPETGKRDIETLDVLERSYGHTDCGVYAKVVQGGAIKLGDMATLIA